VKKSSLERDLAIIRNPAPGVRLVRHGFKVRCVDCQQLVWQDDWTGDSVVEGWRCGCRQVKP
jgi:hypothetical protein